MLKIRPFIQQRDTTCGPASLKIILHYYGIRVPESVLTRQCRTRSDYGTPHSSMIRVMRRYGFRVIVKKNTCGLGDIRSYVARGYPVIVNWYSNRYPPSGGHYSIVIGVEGRMIVLLDPSDGKRVRIPWHEFRQLWFDFDGDLAFHPPPMKVFWRWMMAVLPKSN
ncbi:C39 family peptidase [Candidatus Uhrbacteria bacterium]|nr:C39 family peptidase [Candidatus Uhrbacteria bacterium]